MDRRNILRRIRWKMDTEPILELDLEQETSLVFDQYPLEGIDESIESIEGPTEQDQHLISDKYNENLTTQGNASIPVQEKCLESTSSNINQQPSINADTLSLGNVNVIIINLVSDEDESPPQLKDIPSTSYHNVFSGKMIHLCNLCTISFHSKRQLANHRKAHHNNKDYLCEVCRHSFKDISTFINHQRLHSGDKPYLCEFCGASFGRKSYLRNHKKTHSEEKPHSCRTCSLTFYRKSELITHRKIHAKKPLFTCIICNGHFISQTGLVNHQRMIHFIDRPYICDFCGGSFKRKNTLKRHQSMHCINRPQLDVGSRPTLPGNLNVFNRQLFLSKTQPTNNPYSCDICGLTFNQKSEIINHMWIHYKKKPYLCERCSSSFTKLSDLTVHQRLNYRETRYPCNFCTRLFIKKDDFITHLRIHFGEKPYTCDNCTKTFTNKSHLIGHLKQHSRKKA